MLDLEKTLSPTQDHHDFWVQSLLYRVSACFIFEKIRQMTKSKGIYLFPEAEEDLFSYTGGVATCCALLTI